MRFRVVIAGVFVCLAATACGTAGHASARAGAAPVAFLSHVKKTVRAQAGAKPVVFDCLNHAVTEPGSYILTCADYGSFLAHLSWTGWTSTQATATGVHELNDCTPNCAEGKFCDYPATITFWRPEPLTGHPGETYFSRITVRYTTSHRPPMYMSNGQLIPNPAEWTQTLGR
jgi:hypothetical protein